MRIKKMQLTTDIVRQKQIDLERERLRNVVFRHLAMSDVLMDQIKTMSAIGLRDLKLPGLSIQVNSKLNFIELQFKQVREMLTKVISLKADTVDHMEGDHAAEVYRLLCSFLLMNTDELRAFNDEREKLHVKTTNKP